ncbi:hypothetical protein DWU89_20095 [Parabacteroides acidifaciens]|uniref:Uncharacterized protein n=1 Tax=Parabacteroides acidifaciens TaxID=2290935 RepID=A0A3D8H9Y4_9BACT|nr:hypothetical protein DWU89_20095 [Parabacteroides acidifaciens]
MLRVTGETFFDYRNGWKIKDSYYYITYGIKRWRHDSASFLSVRDREAEGPQKEGKRNNQIIQ